MGAVAVAVADLALAVGLGVELKGVGKGAVGELGLVDLLALDVEVEVGAARVGGAVRRDVAGAGKVDGEAPGVGRGGAEEGEDDGGDGGDLHFERWVWGLSAAETESVCCV